MSVLNAAILAPAQILVCSGSRDSVFSRKLAAGRTLESQVISGLLHLQSREGSHVQRLQQTWVQDGAGAALDGPRLRVESDVLVRNLHPGALVQNLLDFDLYLRMGASIVCRHHSEHQHCQRGHSKALTN